VFHRPSRFVARANWRRQHDVFLSVCPEKRGIKSRCRHRPIWIGILLVTLLLTWATVNHAAEPIGIEADRAMFDERTGTSSFQGDVRLQRGNLNIIADKITLYRKAGHLERAVAEGKPARFTQKLPTGETVHAEARTIEYFTLSEELRLTGSAELRRGKNQFTGEHIIYHIGADRVEASGNGEGKRRVQAIIYPDEGP